MIKGYYASITEHGTGWAKPDGYLIAPSKESFNARKKQIEDAGGPDLYWRVPEPKLCTLKEEAYANSTKMRSDLTVWTDRLAMYVEEF